MTHHDEFAAILTENANQIVEIAAKLLEDLPPDTPLCEAAKLIRLIKVDASEVADAAATGDPAEAPATLRKHSLS